MSSPSCFHVLLVGKPRGGASQQKRAFEILGKTVQVVSTYARGKKEYRNLSTKLCGQLTCHLGSKKKSKSLIIHYQRHVIHVQHILKHGGRPSTTKKAYWERIRYTTAAKAAGEKVPLPLHIDDFDNRENFVAWSDLVGEQLTSKPNAFDASLGARVAYVLPSGEITYDQKEAFLKNYVKPLFQIYEGKVPGNDDAVNAAKRLRATFCTDLVLQHPMLGCCLVKPWHFIIHAGDMTVETLEGPDLGGRRVAISSLRASMFPCPCEPVVAFMHGIGVLGEIFCN